jgi:hypothetical protein
MRNFSLGVNRRDLILYILGAIVAIGFTFFWQAALIGPIGSFWVGNEQRINKYFLTLIIYGIAVVITLLSQLASLRDADRSGRRMLPGFLVRFGLALEIFGILITPIALIYAGDPQRSVPIGFTAFSAVFVGLFVAGFGGNMLAPKRV